MTMEQLDFIRALNERPAWLKLLFRIVVGESAYREFLFMVKTTDMQGYAPFLSYELHDHPYHRDPKPWRWWNKASLYGDGERHG